MLLWGGPTPSRRIPIVSPGSPLPTRGPLPGTPPTTPSGLRRRLGAVPLPVPVPVPVPAERRGSPDGPIKQAAAAVVPQ